jgi:hypothetical protein
MLTCQIIRLHGCCTAHPRRSSCVVCWSRARAMCCIQWNSIPCRANIDAIHALFPPAKPAGRSMLRSRSIKEKKSSQVNLTRKTAYNRSAVGPLPASVRLNSHSPKMVGDLGLSVLNSSCNLAVTIPWHNKVQTGCRRGKAWKGLHAF